MTDNQGATHTATLSITVNPGATAPAAPSNLTATASSGRGVTLNWSDNASNESGFHVERAAKAKSLQFSRVATVGANVRTYARSEAAGTWVYRIQAHNGVGASAYSNSATTRVRSVGPL
ncbi:MAG: fibronectin type III domain-containing protein [Acidobacteria bacterium]|nr:fibronectin type III domain-containing protein [Acidobacteriota bacterium]